MVDMDDILKKENIERVDSWLDIKKKLLRK